MRNRDIDELIKFLFEKWAVEQSPPLEGFNSLVGKIFSSEKYALRSCGNYKCPGEEPDKDDCPVKME